MASENSISRFPLDASIVQRLDSLALLTRRPMASGRPGRRRSPLPGSSMEFSDYRRYAPGDDFRRIDWRAYARLERLFPPPFDDGPYLSIRQPQARQDRWMRSVDIEPIGGAENRLFAGQRAASRNPWIDPGYTGPPGRSEVPPRAGGRRLQNL